MKTNQEIPTCGVLTRIARIKFPQRHPKSSTLGSTCSQAQHETESIESDVPTPPRNAAAGGKASLQAERTPGLGQGNRSHSIGWMHLNLNLNLMMEEKVEKHRVSKRQLGS
ncbi:PREDICTED: uncharacterized protein LOC103333632 [Prunus mume]|uniref:Uncharacterized protein LOC103333632 n=1 Tax=Prunus mume TaxID=102107 RepID=A0ABM0P5P5_PRUMU|nr:PREDICTED: uncharacterized protein LOC103333632 [Prunus mume]